MNKIELARKISKRTGLTIEQAQNVIQIFCENITVTLKAGKKIQLSGFGNFMVCERNAREGINPKTGQKMQIPTSKAIKFKASKIMKDYLNIK